MLAPTLPPTCCVTWNDHCTGFHFLQNLQGLGVSLDASGSEAESVSESPRTLSPDVHSQGTQQIDVHRASGVEPGTWMSSKLHV